MPKLTRNIPPRPAWFDPTKPEDGKPSRANKFFTSYGVVDCVPSEDKDRRFYVVEPLPAKFRVTKFGSQVEIVKVEIVAETRGTVFIRGGGTQPKVGPHTSYHDSFAEAKAYVIERAEREVSSLQGRLILAVDFLNNAKAQNDNE